MYHPDDWVEHSDINIAAINAARRPPRLHWKTEVQRRIDAELARQNNQLEQEAKLRGQKHTKPLKRLKAVEEDAIEASVPTAVVGRTSKDEGIKPLHPRSRGLRMKPLPLPSGGSNENFDRIVDTVSHRRDFEKSSAYQHEFSTKKRNQFKGNSKWPTNKEEADEYSEIKHFDDEVSPLDFDDHKGVRDWEAYSLGFAKLKHNLMQFLNVTKLDIRPEFNGPEWEFRMISEKFEGKSNHERELMVAQALNYQTDAHFNPDAFILDAYTPDEWEQELKYERGDEVRPTQDPYKLVKLDAKEGGWWADKMNSLQDEPLDAEPHRKNWNVPDSFGPGMVSSDDRHAFNVFKEKWRQAFVHQWTDGNESYRERLMREGLDSLPARYDLMNPRKNPEVLMAWYEREGIELPEKDEQPLWMDRYFKKYDVQPDEDDGPEHPGVHMGQYDPDLIEEGDPDKSLEVLGQQLERHNKDFEKSTDFSHLEDTKEIAWKKDESGKKLTGVWFKKDYDRTEPVIMTPHHSDEDPKPMTLDDLLGPDWNSPAQIQKDQQEYHDFMTSFNVPEHVRQKILEDDYTEPAKRKNTKHADASKKSSLINYDVDESKVHSTKEKEEKRIKMFEGMNEDEDSEEDQPNEDHMEIDPELKAEVEKEIARLERLEAEGMQRTDRNVADHDGSTATAPVLAAASSPKLEDFLRFDNDLSQEDDDDAEDAEGKGELISTDDYDPNEDDALMAWLNKDEGTEGQNRFEALSSASSSRSSYPHGHHEDMISSRNRIRNDKMSSLSWVIGAVGITAAALVPVVSMAGALAFRRVGLKRTRVGRRF